MKENGAAFRILRKIGTAFLGLFTLPFTGILGAAFMLAGSIVILAGAVKWLGSIVGFNTSFIMINIGSFNPPALLAFAISIVVGGILFFIGHILWKSAKEFMDWAKEIS